MLLRATRRHDGMGGDPDSSFVRITVTLGDHDAVAELRTVMRGQRRPTGAPPRT
ncbi:MAG: hypothetical protein ACRDRR_00985 [Pseudonocardiaceae bacterium]